MSWEYPSSPGSAERPSPVNKQLVLAVALVSIYTAMQGWAQIIFSFLVQLAAFEPLLPALGFVLGVIATAMRREFLGVLATCVLASVYTAVVFILRNVEWQIVSWAEWTLIRAWVASVLFLAGSLIVMAMKSIKSKKQDGASS